MASDEDAWNEAMWRDDRWLTGPAAPDPHDEARRRRRRRRVVVVLTAVAVLVVVVVGLRSSGGVDGGRTVGLLTGDVTTLPGVDGGDGGAVTGDGHATSRGAGHAEDVPAGPETTMAAPRPDGPAGNDGGDLAIPMPVTAGDDPGTTAPSTATTGTAPAAGTSSPPPAPVQLAVGQVEVPATAADSTDGCGSNVDFDGRLLADGRSDTAWRMDGDGSGSSVTLRLDGPHHIASVGLIPGFASVDACDGTDRFPQNRRITEVTWQFDDGTSVSQELRDEPEMQVVPVSAHASTVTLHIDGVTAPPERDFTAISEVDVRGR